ncbi:hypothetical protein Harman_24820 [Haloarcula mannanilytica]|uniref:Uncharacterized protein n=1 Tax=Haloarcula mannanilytica TaxID=2509225 RepID=A0A4C2ELL5_9EURY|nr:hypothetical protein [Haloarcula mannanilytica]GCF14547.1 hypothetical protein Harman_24820 [Haloarcula mannanilytica]
MPRIRLGGQPARDLQGGGVSADRVRLGIDTDVFELLSNDTEHKMAQSEPVIERWLDCWRNP